MEEMKDFIAVNQFVIFRGATRASTKGGGAPGRRRLEIEE